MPNIYFQGVDESGDLPATQESLRWNEEAEIGTVLTGDGNTTGIFLGALTNAQVSDMYEIVISHDALEPVTNVQFYFQPTTNTRTGGTGFTHDANVTGAEDDFYELRDWGTDFDNGIEGSSEADGLYCMYYNESEDQRALQAFKDGYMDTLATARPLNYDAKPGHGAELVDSISSFNGYGGGDYARLKLRLKAPQYITEAGKRQAAFVCRLTYTF